MSSKKGLGRIISALLAASSFVGQASAANVKRPAGKVKVGKNVVRKERKKKAKSAELDVGGRERRGKGINAYASPLDNPRNWVDAVLGVSTLGLGITAFYKHRKALKEELSKDVELERQTDVALFCALAEKQECLADVLKLCFPDKDDEDVGFLEGKLYGYDSKFYCETDGTLGNEVTNKVIWSNGNKFFCELLASSGVFVGPVARTLKDDINVFVDRCLLRIIVVEFEIEVKTNKREDGTIVDFRTHLMESVNEKCKTLMFGSGVKSAGFLREKVDAIFNGADWLREYLYENLSRYEKKYNEQFKPKKGDGGE